MLTTVERSGATVSVTDDGLPVATLRSGRRGRSAAVDVHDGTWQFEAVRRRMRGWVVTEHREAAPLVARRRAWWSTVWCFDLQGLALTRSSTSRDGTSWFTDIDGQLVAEGGMTAAFSGQRAMYVHGELSTAASVFLLWSDGVLRDRASDGGDGGGF